MVAPPASHRRTASHPTLHPNWVSSVNRPTDFQYSVSRLIINTLYSACMQFPQFMQ